MALNAPAYSTRPISLIMLAAFAALAVWLFSPLGQQGGAPSGSESAPSQLPSMLRLDGEPQVETRDGQVTRLVVPISLRGDESIDLSSGKLRAETEFSDTAIAAVPTTFAIEWPSGNGDHLLDPGETALLTIDIPSKSNVTPENPLRLVYTPDSGPTLIIEDVLP